MVSEKSKTRVILSLFQRELDQSTLKELFPTVNTIYKTVTGIDGHIPPANYEGFDSKYLKFMETDTFKNAISGSSANTTKGKIEFFVTIMNRGDYYSLFDTLIKIAIEWANFDYEDILTCSFICSTYISYLKAHEKNKYEIFTDHTKKDDGGGSTEK